MWIAQQNTYHHNVDGIYFSKIIIKDANIKVELTAIIISDNVTREPEKYGKECNDENTNVEIKSLVV